MNPNKELTLKCSTKSRICHHSTIW